MEIEEFNYRKYATQKLTDYLKDKGYRKTLERYAILDEICSRKGHFDIETLFDFMIDKNFRVSRATIYNTLELFVDCKLVVRHQFGENISKYESFYDATHNDHLICTNCGRIIEFDNSEIKR
jgi:Fur family ferric uptake transcriptional regulator